MLLQLTAVSTAVVRRMNWENGLSITQSINQLITPSVNTFRPARALFSTTAVVLINTSNSTGTIVPYDYCIVLHVNLSYGKGEGDKSDG